MSRTDGLLGGISLLGLRQVISLITGLVSAVVLVRYLGPSDYGLYATVIGQAGLLKVVTGNFEEAVRRYVPEHVAAGRDGAARRTMLAALGLRLMLGLLVGGALVLVADPLATLYGHSAMAPMIAVAGAFVLSEILDAIGGGLFMGLQTYRPLAAWAVVQGVVLFGVIGVSAVLDLSLVTFWAAHVVAQLVLGAALLGLGVRALWRRSSGAAAGWWRRGWREGLARLWSYSWPLWGGGATYALYQHGTRAVLGLFVPAASVGYFSVAKTVLERLTDLYHQVPSALLPSLSERMAVEGREVALGRLSALAPWVSALAFTMAVTTFGLAPELIRWLAGSDYGPAVLLLQLFAVQLLFRLPSNIWGTAYYLFERTRTLFWIGLARVVPMFVAVLLASRAFGVVGATVVEAVSYVPALALIGWHAARHLDVPVRQIAGGPARALGAGLVAGGLLLVAGDALWLRALIVLSAPTLLFVAGLLDREDVEAVHALSPASPWLRYPLGVAGRYLAGLERLVRLLPGAPSGAGR